MYPLPKKKTKFVKQYPNPANDIVHYSSSKMIEEIVIFNQIGQINRHKIMK